MAKPIELKWMRAIRLATFVVLVPILTAPVPAKFQLIGLNRIDWLQNTTATDAEWFYLNTDHSTRSQGGGVYNPIEWELSREWQIPAVVYQKGDDLVIQLRFVNPGFVSRDVSLVVNDVQLYIPPQDPQDDPTIVELSDDGPHEMSLPAFGGTDTATITITDVPNYVARGWLQWDLEAIEDTSTIWDTDGLANVEQIVLLTHATPNSHMWQPWTNVLWLACTWALFDTTEEDCAKDCTFGVFYSQKFAYNLHEHGVPCLWMMQTTSLGSAHFLAPPPSKVETVLMFRHSIRSA